MVMAFTECCLHGRIGRRWAGARLVQNGDFVAEIGPFREQGGDLCLGRHLTILDKGQVLTDLQYLVLHLQNLPNHAVRQIITCIVAHFYFLGQFSFVKFEFLQYRFLFSYL